jgi:hypothetical protein
MKKGGLVVKGGINIEETGKDLHSGPNRFFYLYNEKGCLLRSSRWRMAALNNLFYDQLFSMAGIDSC